MEPKKSPSSCIGSPALIPILIERLFGPAPVLDIRSASKSLITVAERRHHPVTRVLDLVASVLTQRVSDHVVVRSNKFHGPRVPEGFGRGGVVDYVGKHYRSEPAVHLASVW